MNFFTNLINTIRGINKKTAPVQQFVFGSIISGTYSNAKHDFHPTILCLGNYQKNGKWYVHGIQLHYLGGNLSYILGTINNIKSKGIVTTPILFYNYLKNNNPLIIKNCYRTYLSNLCDFKTVNPGFSNINENYCYPISDVRDNFLNTLNQKKSFIQNIKLGTQQLRENITAALNTVKIW